jgi:hypothetical protein
VPAEHRDRGEYRSLFASFADDPDVHQLSGDAVKLLLMLKLSLPATGIGVMYPSKLCDQVGCDRNRLEQIFDELEKPQPVSAHGWIRRERNVVWIINALRFEPNLQASNRKKHVPFVRRLVAALDVRLEVVLAFKDYYAEWFADDPSPDEGNRKGTDSLSLEAKRRAQSTQLDRKAVGNEYGTDSLYKGRGYLERRVSDQKQLPSLSKPALTSGDLEQERARERDPSPAPLADAIAALPARVQDFLEKFYPEATASDTRRRDVVRQLTAMLGAGVRLTRDGAIIRATADRLEAKCNRVMHEGVRVADRAIVILLRKLADVSDVTPPGIVADQQRNAETREVERDRAQRLAAAETWLAAHRDIAASIDEALDRELGPDPELARDKTGGVARLQRLGDQLAKTYRAMQRTYLVLQAYEDQRAAEPRLAHGGAR